MIGKGQTALDHAKAFAFYSKDSGKPLKHFKLWGDPVRFAFGCDMDKGEESSQSGHREDS